MARKKRKKFKKLDLKMSPKLMWRGGIFLAGLIILSALGYAIYVSSVFVVEEGDIKSDLPLSAVLKQKIKGESLFSLDIDEISSRLIKEYPEYKGIYVLRQFPSSLVIRAQKRRPFAQLKGKRYYLIDKEAMVISNGLRESQPGIIPIEISDYDSFLMKGKIIDDKRLGYAFELMKALRRQDFLSLSAIELINATQPDALYFMVSGESFGADSSWRRKDIKVIIGKDEFNRKLEYLKEVISQRIQDKISSVEYIDLRYKKVYVGFRR